ncbi:hypothetical protein [Agrobacterium tumefaciens]|uniref:hypothetical protein n=2 Tax=Rhizobium/Agrobacterium group TaxID=227290 RepID=UPI0003A88B65|nr:hypothetical protein FY131_23060 [Agrobacterium tumefaciens]
MFAVRREQIDVSRQAFEVVFRDVSIAAVVLDLEKAKVVGGTCRDSTGLFEAVENVIAPRISGEKDITGWRPSEKPDESGIEQSVT